VPEPIGVVIVGTGLYVCGAGTDGHGTILPAVLQARREGRVGRVLLAARDGAAFARVAERAVDLGRRLDVDARFERFPAEDREDPQAYRAAFEAAMVGGGRAAAIIATPDHLHHEMAAAALEAGLPVLVTKPLTPTVAEARALVALCRRRRGYGAVELHKRFDPANRELRAALARGDLGEPLHVQVDFSQRRSVPAVAFRRWAARASVFQYLGVHYADLIHHVTGARPVRVAATGQHGWLRAQGIDAHDAVQAVVEWERGGRRFASTLATAWVDPDGTTAASYQAIRLLGTGGRFESDQRRRGVELVTVGRGTEEVNPQFCRRWLADDGRREVFAGYGIDSVDLFLRDAADVLAGRVAPAALEGRRPTFRDALVSTAVVEAVATSLGHHGAWVGFAEDLTPVAAVGRPA
jgi:predicted dehydrogenase